MLKSIETSPSQKHKLEKSSDSDLKSSKDIPSSILDSKVFAKSDLLASAMSQDTNMTNSNFTSNSNMTGSNTGYPMSSSGDILSSSIDLDMKFDHFGESETTNSIDNRDTIRKVHKEVVESLNDDMKMDVDEGSTNVSVEKDGEFVCQHISDVFTLLFGHTDPQIKGMSMIIIITFNLSYFDYF